MILHLYDTIHGRQSRILLLLHSFTSTTLNIENIDNNKHYKNNNRTRSCSHIMLSKFGVELKSAIIVVEDNGEDYVGHRSKKDGERQNPRF